MIKSIKMRSAFFIISVGIINSITGMEGDYKAVKVDSSESGPACQEHINVQREESQDSHSLLINKIASELKPIKEEITPENVFKSIVSPNIIVSIKALANVLLFQSWLIQELRSVNFHNDDLLYTSSNMSNCCFALGDATKKVCGHPSNCERLIILTHPLAQELAMDIVARLWFEEDIWDNAEALNQFYYKANLLVDHEIDETCFVARYIINSIAGHWLAIRMGNFDEDMTALFANMEFNDSTRAEDTLELLSKINGLRYLLNKYLINEKIYKAVQNFLPNYIDIVSLVWDFKEYFYDLWEKGDEGLEFEDALKIKESLNNIIKLYEKIAPACDELYKIVFSQLCDKPKLYRQVFLMPVLSFLPKNLDVPVRMSGFRDYETEYETENETEDADKLDYIKDILTAPHKVKKDNLPVKRKKRSRNRRNKKGRKQEESESNNNNSEKKSPVKITQDSLEISLPEEDEIIKFPLYAERIHKWFADDWEQEGERPSAKSIIYHTYPKSTDYFTQKYGVWHEQPNQILSHLTDKAYYIMGQIEYSDGRIEEVIFGICFHKGKCYHRGFSDKIDNKYMAEEDFGKFVKRFKNSKLMSTVSTLPITRKHITVEGENVEYAETPYFVKIYDSVHQIVITLFKAAPLVQ